VRAPQYLVPTQPIEEPQPAAGLLIDAIFWLCVDRLMFSTD
jgi:hypothetical protein